MRRLIRPLRAAAAAAVACTSLVVAHQPALGADGLRLAVSFDKSLVANWVHTNQAAGSLVGSKVVTTSPAGTITRPTWTGSNVLLPTDVEAVPGVVVDRATPPVDPQSTKAAGFPAHVAQGSTPGAAYIVTPTNSTGRALLSPGQSVFTLGADLRLDTGVTAESGTNDDGNNVVQRGLSGTDQYKIQVDGPATNPVASCYIRDEGTTTVSASVPVSAGQWVRIRCVRSVVDLGQGPRDRVVLTVSVPTAPDDPLQIIGTVTETGTTPAANLDFSSGADARPLAIGAKVNAQGGLVSAGLDQFNGRIDNVFLAIG